MTLHQAHIVARAEYEFDQEGFAATGVDRLAEAAGVSSRTLYKHLGSKAGVAASVLRARSDRFFASLDTSSVDALFATLQEWFAAEGSRGCLFLRAHGESIGAHPQVAPEISGYRDQLRESLARVVANERGHEDAALAEQILVVFEGAVSASSYRGAEAITAARTAAVTLVGRRP